MFINAVVIVLQEILEAALMLSLLLAFLRYFNEVTTLSAVPRALLLRRRWAVYSVVLGVVFAWLYSVNLGTISEAFDYVGLEVANAAIHSLSCLFLVVIAWLFPVPFDEESDAKKEGYPSIRIGMLTLSMVIVVTLAILREGSEIMQFAGGIIGQHQSGLSVLYGGLVGAGIGISTGVLLYFGLTGLPPSWSLRTCTLLLALMAGNMAAQAVLLLTQADWLPYTAIAWDSGALLDEASVLGQLSFALVGYESTPSWLQVAAYVMGVLAVGMSATTRFAWRMGKSLQLRGV